MNVKITDDNGIVYEGILTKTVAPIPPSTSPYIMLNCINWGAGMTTPLQKCSEATYFVLLSSANGTLSNGNEAQERAFITKVHAAGGKATFSIGGGTQNIANITSAVTNRAGLIAAIQARLAWGYDGVTLDIENTNISSATMNAFITSLRAAIGTAIIGIYTQPYARTTTWKDIGLIKDKFNWISSMNYDFPNTTSEFIAETQLWVDMVGKDKVLAGMAVNYDTTGLNLTELPIVMNWVKGIKGIGIWENVAYTQAYQDIVNKY